jgi:hypothetical protein
MTKTFQQLNSHRTEARVAIRADQIMRRNYHVGQKRNFATCRSFALVALMIFCASFFAARVEECFAQEKPPPEYDYKSLATASILDSAAEASKLPNVEQRVSLLLAAAKLLSASRRDDAISLLEIALRDLKAWVSDEKSVPRQRYLGAKLRAEVLSVYAQLDPEKATTLLKENQTDSDSSKDVSKSLRPNAHWTAAILNGRKQADETARIALSLVDSDPDRASALVLQSVGGGIVSLNIFDIVQKLDQNGNRQMVDQLEASLSLVLRSTFTLDPFSLSSSSSLARDSRMTQATRGGFIKFLMSSLETWSTLVKGEDGAGGLDPSYISSSFMAFFLNVRPVIAQYSPTDLLRVEALFEQVSPFVPEKMRSMLQASLPEKFSDPKDRLNDILKDPSPEKRDLRLIRLVSGFLRKTEEMDQSEIDVVSDAISHFSDAGLKMTFGDCLTIKRVNLLVKTKGFTEARRLAQSISSEDSRAWTMLALATAAKEDRILGFELTSAALKALDSASPGPLKVDLALRAAAILARDEPQRAFEALSAAAKYANSAPSKSDELPNSGRGLRLEATVGNMRILLANGPESLAGIELDNSLSLLALSDWFRSQYVANDFREPTLRPSLKLQFAGTVLDQALKQKKTATAKQPSLQ